MFGSGKPTGFGTPFGASTGSTSGFGSTAFGQSTPSAGGLFGQNPSAGTGAGLFGSGGGSAFGTQSSGFNFGATPSAGGGLFGQKTTANTGLFGTPAASSTTNAFSFGSTGGFGTTSSTASTGGLFGSTNNTGTSLFGNSGFGQPQSGTTVKFNPPQGQDTMVKNGVTQNINTKHQCITAMKEYENKSLEELRVEDYIAGRKGKQQATTGFGFASPAPSSTQVQAFAFGQAKPTGFGASTGFGTSTSTGTTGLFGQPNTQASTGLFGQSKTLFGTPATTASTGFGFGTNTSTGTGLFGTTTQNKPLFGTTTTTASGGLFGTTGSTFGQTASTGFGGFGATTQSGGLFASKPAFGAQTSTSTGFGGFGSNSNTGANLFAKPFAQPSSTGFGFNTSTASTGFGSTQPFGAKPGGFGLTTTTAAPSFNFGGGPSTGTSLFGTSGLAKPGVLGGFGTTGTTGFGGFGTTATNLATAPALGGTTSQPVVNQAAQLQQTLQALTYSPYGDSPLFWNLKDSAAKREEVLRPTNPVAQKAILANQHKVSPRPIAKIKPKPLSGVLNGSKSKLFEGLDEDDFSFGSDTFKPRKSVKKLTLKRVGQESGTPSRASSVSGEPLNVSSLREEDQFRGRSSPVAYSSEQRRENPSNVPDTENIIRSKGISDQMVDTPDRRPNMDDTIAMLNAQNKSGQREPVMMEQSADDTVNVSIISRDDTANDDVNFDERPTTPPPPHPAGIVLTRPGYYTIPSLEALGELVDSDGNCNVEDFTIGREGYGSVFFPGITNVANINFDETVFFRRKEVIVYPDDDNKPEVGEGLNKKAEITLDCVWPRDKSVGTPIKSPEKLQAMRWQDKIEENSLKVGAKFIDYRPETGSWVFEVKHFSKYGLLDDSDDEDVPEQDKKRLRTAQQQQMAVQVSTAASTGCY